MNVSVPHGADKAEGPKGSGVFYGIYKEKLRVFNTDGGKIDTIVVSPNDQAETWVKRYAGEKLEEYRRRLNANALGGGRPNSDNITYIDTSFKADFADVIRRDDFFSVGAMLDAAKQLHIGFGWDNAKVAESYGVALKVWKRIVQTGKPY